MKTTRDEENRTFEFGFKSLKHWFNNIRIARVSSETMDEAITQRRTIRAGNFILVRTIPRIGRGSNLNIHKILMFV